MPNWNAKRGREKRAEEIFEVMVKFFLKLITKTATDPGNLENIKQDTHTHTHAQTHTQ